LAQDFIPNTPSVSTACSRDATMSSHHVSWALPTKLVICLLCSQAFLQCVQALRTRSSGSGTPTAAMQDMCAHMLLRASVTMSSPSENARMSSTLAWKRNRSADDPPRIELKYDNAPQLRVYVYDMPSPFTTDILSEPPPEGPACGWTNTYAEELLLHRQLLNSPVRTLDPELADLFYVPFYLFDDCAPWDLRKKCRRDNWFCFDDDYIGLFDTPGKALAHVAETWEFFNRSAGADHLAAITVDMGRCMMSPEHRKRFSEVRFLLASSEYGEGRGCFRPGYDVAIPPMIGEDYLEYGEIQYRGIGNATGNPLAMFIGEYNPILYDNASLQRKHLLARYKCTHEPTCSEADCTGSRECPERGVIVWDHHTPAYVGFLARSRYCIHAEGTAYWSNRLYASIVVGCVPVVYTGEHESAFSMPVREVVPYEDIVVKIPFSLLNRTAEILRGIGDEEYRQRLNGMRQGREALMYRDPPVVGGALDSTLWELSRLHKQRESLPASRFDALTGAPLKTSL